MIVVFKYLTDIEATDSPINYTRGLKDPPKRAIRKHEATQEEKLSSREEIKALIAATRSAAHLSHLYLGINTAYGRADIGRRKTLDIGFENSWLGEIRGRTGEVRGRWLWPEAVEVLRQAIDEKPWNPQYPDLYSLTRNRNPWWTSKGEKSDPVTAGFARTKERAKIQKKGVGQYSLRHTFRTIGGYVGEVTCTLTLRPMRLTSCSCGPHRKSCFQSVGTEYFSTTAESCL